MYNSPYKSHLLNFWLVIPNAPSSISQSVKITFKWTVRQEFLSLICTISTKSNNTSLGLFAFIWLVTPRPSGYGRPSVLTKRLDISSCCLSQPYNLRLWVEISDITRLTDSKIGVCGSQTLVRFFNTSVDLLKLESKSKTWLTLGRNQKCPFQLCKTTVYAGLLW